MRCAPLARSTQLQEHLPYGCPTCTCSRRRCASGLSSSAFGPWSGGCFSAERTQWRGCMDRVREPHWTSFSISRGMKRRATVIVPTAPLRSRSALVARIDEVRASGAFRAATGTSALWMPGLLASIHRAGPRFLTSPSPEVAKNRARPRFQRGRVRCAPLARSAQLREHPPDGCPACTCSRRRCAPGLSSSAFGPWSGSCFSAE